MTTRFPMRTPSEKRKAYLTRLAGLESERSSWITHWADIAKHLLPRGARFFETDRNRTGRERYGSILDNTASRALRVLSAGMMAGMTSPVRPWFKLTTRDKDLAESHSVRLWLDDVRARMLGVFAKSNVYRSLLKTYSELGAFGTSCMMVLPDFDSVIRCYPMIIGQYSLQQDYQGRVTTMYRVFQRTVAEIVKEFGYENCGKSTQQAWDSRQFENSVKILHVVEPREDQERDLNSPTSENMPWRSIYLEMSENDGKILRESGFKRLRILAPRWAVEGDDVYGISPGMEALGDIRQLQQEQLRKSQAIDYKTKPPLQVPTSMKGRESDQLPGGRTYVEPGDILPFDQASPAGGIRAAFEVNLELNELLLDIVDVRDRINKAFYVDLFLMLATHDPSRMTATEVLERQEEKLLMIGPVIDRMSNELLEPLIDVTFNEMLEVDALPPIPPELLGQELEIEFISILAQAQRAVGINSTQQFISEIVSVAQTRPDVLDVINFDEWVRITAHMRGVDNDLLLDGADVQALRDARAQAEAEMEQTALAGQQAQAARDLSQAPLDDNTALSALLGTR